jgi:hypothetical protein
MSASCFASRPPPWVNKGARGPLLLTTGTGSVALDRTAQH